MFSQNTFAYYDDEADFLIDQYDNAKMDTLHGVFKKHIKPENSVLDLGFGSGRDLRVIMGISDNVFGLDACDTFISNANNNKKLQGRVSKTILPEIDISGLKTDTCKFDVVVSIAVLMHLPLEDIKKSAKNIASVLDDGGISVISYPLNRKSSDTRHFEPLEEGIMTSVFSEEGFEKIDEMRNGDGLGREVVWVTEVYQLKNDPLLKQIDTIPSTLPTKDEENTSNRLTLQ